MRISTKELVWLTEDEVEIAIREFVAKKTGRTVRRHATITGFKVEYPQQGVAVALGQSSAEVTA